MLAYDYLKENPQLRHKQMQINWAELFMDPVTPFSVKQELKEIQLFDTDPSDAVLFWHQHYTMYTLMGGTLPTIEPYVWQSHWVKTLYHLEGVDNRDMIKICLKILCSLKEYHTDISLTNEELRTLINRTGHLSYSMSELIIRAMTNVYCDTQMSETLIRRCTQKLLRSTQNERQLRSMYELLRDVDFSTRTEKFDSINEIEQAHDKDTERAVEKLLKECSGDRFIYNSIFIEAVDSCGFFLPLGPSSLVERGAKHSNCVAQYKDKQLAFGNNMMRLIFSKIATIEMVFELKHDVIVSTRIQQCKGRFNRDVEQDENLTALRCKLVGMPMKILEVEKHGPETVDPKA